MIRLKKLSVNDGRDIHAMLQGIAKEENGFHNDVNGMPYHAFAQWLERNDKIARGIGLPDWMVPQTTFWLFCGEEPVGIGRIRHYLTEALKENGGHIGYAIAFPHRGKGYGNEILRQLLMECNDMGIREVLIVPYQYNEPSNKMVRFNGGQLVRKTETKNYYIIQTGNK